MSINQTFIAELKHESASTRKMIERVPTEKNTWKPHEKSMVLGRLASHVAEIPGWITMIMKTDELDLAAAGMVPHVAENNEELLGIFDNNLNGAVESLSNAAPEDFEKIWTLRRGEHVIYAMPKGMFLRSIAYSHLYHHRGQLSVYLRLLDVPVPGMYGPSADEKN